MGRMKDLYMDLLHANDGHIPQEATLADLQRMRDLEIFEWKEYEQLQEKNRLQFFDSEDSAENAKIEQVNKKFSAYYGKAREEKKSKQ
jgi:hypothetical protein